MSKRIVGLIASSLIFAAGIGVYYSVMTRGAPAVDATTVSESETAQAATQPQDLETDPSGLSKLTAVIQTTRGKIRFKFYPKEAPKTSHRIIELIQKGFYDGLTFHRVVPGFVVQGGDPTGSGMGGSGVKLDAEFNSRKHVPGTVAMARSPTDLNSADSQFYISLGTHPHLDNQYTVFGQVIEGQEVANQLQVGDRMTSFAVEK